MHLKPSTFFGTPTSEAYDGDGNFSIEKYFAIRYGKIHSHLLASVDLPESQRTYLTVLSELSISPDSPDILRRNWDFEEKDDKEAFIDEMIYASSVEALCVQIYVYEDSTNVNFYYDGSDRDLESRLVRLAQHLESQYSETDQPKFEVLTINHARFTTTEIEIKPITVDLARHYNDDFVPVDQTIRRAIEQQSSGLILLHGLPGTGKTSYIKSLITAYPKQRLIFIPNDFVQEMLQPGFINFLLTKKDSIIVIEDAEKVIMSRNDSGQNSVVSTILQITDGLFSDFLNIKIICTFNTDISRIDQALFRKGRMIAFYEFGELTEEKARSLLGPDVELPARRTLADLFNADTTNYREEADAVRRRIGFRPAVAAN